MLAAVFLTVLAVAGVWAGAGPVQAGKPAEYATAAGGGLLLGIALFWLLPEAGGWVWLPAVIGLALALALLDNAVSHQRLIWPILAATAMHSFLDGVGVRLLPSVTVIAALTLHKIPEGIALGWVLRNTRRALLIGSAAEGFTILGAVFESKIKASGDFQTAVMLLIAGGFVFFGSHAVLSVRKQPKPIALTVATLLVVAALTFCRE